MTAAERRALAKAHDAGEHRIPVIGCPSCWTEERHASLAEPRPSTPEEDHAAGKHAGELVAGCPACDAIGTAVELPAPGQDEP